MDPKEVPTALGEYVLIRHAEQAEETTKSGLIISTEDKKRDGNIVYITRGEFLSQGYKVEMSFKEGDILFYNPFDATTLVGAAGERDIHALHEKFIKGIIRK